MMSRFLSNVHHTFKNPSWILQSSFRSAILPEIQIARSRTITFPRAPVYTSIIHTLSTKPAPIQTPAPALLFPSISLPRSVNWIRLSWPLSQIPQVGGRTRHRGSSGSGSRRSPLDNIPQNYVFYGIIGVNVAVFLAWQSAQAEAKHKHNMGPLVSMFNNFTSSWRNLSEGRVWTLVTAMFSQKDLGHFFFNGFAFFFMARPVLQMLGSKSFLGLYFAGGLIATITSMFFHNKVRNRDPHCLGASAAVYSIVTLLACVAPNLTFQIYGIIPVPAWLCVSGMFAYDMFGAVKDAGGGTDQVGHVAGMLTGAGYFLLKRFRIF
ncbi:serine protease family [Moniliophthora roreri]|nr:serine protease family [Moniliophthora roreri]